MSINAVTDNNERTMTVGDVQTEWLIEQGLVSELETGDPNVRMFRTDIEIGRLNKLLFDQLKLRECDFCRVLGAPWEIPCRPFKLTTGLAPGPLGGPERPMVACSVCVELVKNNRKQQLIDRIVDETIQEMRRKGGPMKKIVQSHPYGTLRRQILPIAKDVVTGMFAHRDGYPRLTDAA